MNDNTNAQILNIKHFGVKMIRLVTGEDLMAEASMNQETGGLILKNPMLVILNSNKEGKADLGIVDWLPLMATDSVEINGMTMIALYDPQQILKDQYAKMFDKKVSNVITPKVPGLVGFTK